MRRLQAAEVLLLPFCVDLGASIETSFRRLCLLVDKMICILWNALASDSLPVANHLGMGMLIVFAISDQMLPS